MCDKTTSICMQGPPLGRPRAYYANHTTTKVAHTPLQMASCTERRLRKRDYYALLMLWGMKAGRPAAIVLDSLHRAQSQTARPCFKSSTTSSEHA